MVMRCLRCEKTRTTGPEYLRQFQSWIDPFRRDGIRYYLYMLNHSAIQSFPTGLDQ